MLPCRVLKHPREMAAKCAPRGAEFSPPGSAMGRLSCWGGILPQGLHFYRVRLSGQRCGLWLAFCFVFFFVVVFFPFFKLFKANTVGGQGKDRIIFATKEDHETPSSAELVADDPDDPYEEQGLILPNGDINWNCPCLGGMASGPCGEQFKSAFSCFHYSTEEIKGSDCVDQFRAMQECMQKYPDLYPQEDENDEKEKSSKDLEATPMEASAAEEKGSS
ncbi:mitochondrial intermembrane space import and assembly protein 40 isoform X1 [Columba livia]